MNLHFYVQFSKHNTQLFSFSIPTTHIPKQFFESCIHFLFYNSSSVPSKNNLYDSRSMACLFSNCVNLYSNSETQSWSPGNASLRRVCSAHSKFVAVSEFNAFCKKRIYHFYVRYVLIYVIHFLMFDACFSLHKHNHKNLVYAKLNLCLRMN